MTIMMTRTSNNRPPPPATPPITFFALDDKPSTTSYNYNEYDQLNPQQEEFFLANFKTKIQDVTFM